MEHKTLRELIGTIHIDESNLNHISKTKAINGTLLIEIERVANTYAEQQNGYLNEEIDDLEQEVDDCDHDFRQLQKKYETLSTEHAKMLEMLEEALQHIDDLKEGDSAPFALRSFEDKARELLSFIKKGGSDE